MNTLAKIFLLATILGGITLFAVGAVTDENALSSVYTYLSFVILLFALTKLELFKKESSNKKDKKSQFIASAIISFTAGFFGPYVALFYYISREVSNISLF